MSDKSKRRADDAALNAHIQEDLSRQAVAAAQGPRCLCGHGLTDRTILASHDKRDRVIFYCQDCVPAEMKAAFEASRKLQS